MTDQEKNKKLEAENKMLKAHLKEGREVFSILNDVLGIQAAAESGMLLLKIPLIIRKTQQQPEIIDNVTNYLDKINKLDL